MSKQLLLIDTTNAAHRALHRGGKLTHRNMDVGVLYGCTRIVLSAVKKFAPTCVVVCYDESFPHVRRLLVPTYKLRREQRHRDTDGGIDWSAFSWQLEASKELFGAMGMVVARAPYLEADDMIAACVRLLKYDTCTIVSTDGDMLQLVNSQVVVWNPIKDSIDTCSSVYAEYGVRPEQFRLYKALVGDTADEIPGVRGIGPKTAAKMLQCTNATKSTELFGKLDMLDAKTAALLTDAQHTLNSYEVVIGLAYDMHGADYALWKCLNARTPYNEAAVAKLLQHYAFTSIVTDTEARLLLKRTRLLECKPLKTSVRYPGRRVPVCHGR